MTIQPGATVLGGWDPDATFWLRDDHIIVEDNPTEWRLTSGGRWTHVRTAAPTQD
ncbi:hypothetical protein [Skermania sp. ID1734]|uniref:hypothetical protein n=1 Tax=Skermania sp. ID1734 TaxID=2597516 RepID=UPI00163D3E90|nr:hypothetical protein [Skermania sp. ID1734]